MTQLFTNGAKSTLAAAITSNSQTSITLSAGQGALFPNPTGSDFFMLTLDDGTHVEIVKVTARSTDTLTIVRGQEGTTAQASFAIGTKAELRITATTLAGLAQLAGATFTGDVKTTSTTASTSTTTGAWIVAGGVGIGGATYIGGLFKLNDLTDTSTAGYNRFTSYLTTSGASLPSKTNANFIFNQNGDMSAGGSQAFGVISTLNLNSGSSTWRAYAVRGAIIVNGGAVTSGADCAGAYFSSTLSATTAWTCGALMGTIISASIPSSTTYAGMVYGLTGSDVDIQVASSVVTVSDTAVYRAHIYASAGTITNAYGFKLETPSTGATITNLYGLYLPDLSGATNVYAIKTGIGKVVFGDTTKAATFIATNIQAVTSAATVTPDAASAQVNITAQAVGLTLANPTGTWLDGQECWVRIKDNGGSQTIAYGTNIRAFGTALPTATTAGKTTYIKLKYNAADSKWDAIQVITQV